MNKKVYNIPEATVLSMETELVMAGSYTGSTNIEGLTVGGIDTSGDDNRSRLENIWDDEDGE